MSKNDNHDVSGPIDEELTSIQKDIIQEIRKTQTLMIFQMIALLLFALCNGGFFVPYITYEISGNVVIPRIIIAFFFFIAVLRSAIKFSPFLQKGYKILQDIEVSNINGNFKSGIVRYVAEFYQLSKEAKNKYCRSKRKNSVEKVPKVFLWELIAFLIIGVLVIGYDIALLSWYPTHTSAVFNITFFSITAVFYTILVILTLILKKRTDKWLTGFMQITEWGKKIESKYGKSEGEE